MHTSGNSQSCWLVLSCNTFVFLPHNLFYLPLSRLAAKKNKKQKKKKMIRLSCGWIGKSKGLQNYRRTICSLLMSWCFTAIQPILNLSQRYPICTLPSPPPLLPRVHLLPQKGRSWADFVALLCLFFVQKLQVQVKVCFSTIPLPPATDKQQGHATVHTHYWNWMPNIWTCFYPSKQKIFTISIKLQHCMVIFQILQVL